MIDLHDHIVPGVDDGAPDLAASRAALEAYRAQGVAAVVATPHARASLAERPRELAAFLERIDAAWEELRSLAAEFPSIRLERGMEVMLDTPAADLSDARLRLAGTRFALVEFPFMAVPPHAARALEALAATGVVPVLAHPERYLGAGGADAAAEAWRRAGAHLQVNAGSLLGRFGEAPRRAACDLLERGLASYLASDYHARGTPQLAAARAWLEEAGAGEQAGLLLEANPGRLLRDEPPLPVAPLPERRPRSFFGRLFTRGG